MNRPIGIYEWCALTEEMLEEVYPQGVFSRRSLPWLDQLRSVSLNINALLHPDAIERGEKLLREKEDGQIIEIDEDGNVNPPGVQIQREGK